jgi:hypothetical protein
MNFWMITSPNLVDQMIYVDRTGKLGESRVRMAVYRELYPNDMFQRPEINLRKMNLAESTQLKLRDVAMLLNGHTDIVCFCYSNQEGFYAKGS